MKFIKPYLTFVLAINNIDDNISENKENEVNEQRSTQNVAVGDNVIQTYTSHADYIASHDFKYYSGCC